MKPIFHNEKIGKFMSMGIIHYWSQEKEDLFKKLSWDERYNASSRGMYVITKKEKDRKNSEEYKKELEC